MKYRTMTIVVVEDESRVLNFISEALRKEGHTVYPCGEYDEALSLMHSLSEKVDVLVMDRLLGQRDAITLIPTAKAQCRHAKILVLSAINEPMQKAAALDLGADDYLGKPFQLIELSARIRSLARQRVQVDSGEQNRHTYSIKNMTVNAIERKVSIENKVIDLSNKEYLVLLALIQHPGRVYNRFQLLDRVWNTQFDVESNVVEVTIKNLRKKLSDAGSEAEILSRRNIGYWIEA